MPFSVPFSALMHGPRLAYTRSRTRAHVSCSSIFPHSTGTLPMGKSEPWGFLAPCFPVLWGTRVSLPPRVRVPLSPDEHLPRALHLQDCSNWQRRKREVLALHSFHFGELWGVAFWAGKCAPLFGSSGCYVCCSCCMSSFVLPKWKNHDVVAPNVFRWFSAAIAAA